jgi:LysM repeat protein
MIHWLSRLSILSVGFLSTLALDGLRADESSAMATPSTTEPAMGAERPATYTVVSGDTLWDISRKFDTSIKKLKALNHLKKNNLKPGQVLKIPTAGSAKAAKKTTSLKAKSKKKVASTHAHHAPPVLGDLPASNLGYYWNGKAPDYHMPSGPLPAPTSVVQPSAETATIGAPAQDNLVPTAKPQVALREPNRSARDSNWSTPTETMAESTPAAQSPHRGLFNFFYTPPPSVDWGARFTQTARELGDRGLEYNEDWRPPGEAHSWSMDCSNTSRYIYRVTTGIQLPRTASDQYYYLHLQNKAWDVPQTSTGFADCNYLRRNLRAGDLLFWENTYKPDRQPPITHVMIFLGTNARGEWTMAGSQSTRGGEHNRRHGGPDIYVFNPTRPCGGYSTWLGFVHHQGRFCAYGRPLEADKSKLAMAADD